MALCLDTTGENVTEVLVSEGLVEVRRGGIKPSEYVPSTSLQVKP